MDALNRIKVVLVEQKKTGQLLDQLDAYLPEDFGERRNITYIELFVGESLE